MRALMALVSIPKGKARFKLVVANGAPFDAAALSYRQDLLAWLRSERASGRRLILATGADSKIANAVSRHLGLFEAVIASDGRINMTGERKASEIRRYLDNAPFLYAGDSRSDMKIWALSEAAIVINPHPDRVAALQQAGIPVMRMFASGGSNAKFRPRIVFAIAFGLCAALILFFLMRRTTV
jgi:phosphoserine phosphatase